MSRGGNQTFSRWARALIMAAGLALSALTAGCVVGASEGEGPVVHIHVPAGASFATTLDSLDAHGIVQYPRLFRVYARVTGADRSIKPGVYGFRSGMGWDQILADLRQGRVLTQRITIPEGWELRKIAPRLAAATDSPPDSVLQFLADSATAARFSVPGPSLEGYIYPATYTLPLGTSLEAMVEVMVDQYRKIWTPARRARADSLNWSEREVITLASIVEKEARIRDEMSTIAAVYHNRLRIGYPLQADPTVQYALGTHQTRLLYRHIDSVEDNPYNTYRHAGLPPGPIASPSTAAVDATLYPADVPFLYFVARPDGSHIFTRSLVEHNRAREQVRREQRVRQVETSTGAENDVPSAPVQSGSEH